MLKYTPKVFLVFKLPKGTHSGFFRQNQRLGDIITALYPGGRTTLDQAKSIGELGLKHDDVIEIKANSNKSFWPVRR